MRHVRARLRNRWSHLVSGLAWPATLVALLELSKVWMLSQEGLAHGLCMVNTPDPSMVHSCELLGFPPLCSLKFPNGLQLLAAVR